MRIFILLTELAHPEYHQGHVYGNDYTLLNYLSLALILICAVAAIWVIYFRKPKPDLEEIRLKNKKLHKHSKT